MKYPKSKILFALSFASLILSACGTTGGETSSDLPAPPSSSDAPVVTPEDSTSSIDDGGEQVDPPTWEVFDGVIRIYYHNDVGDEASYAIYGWIDGVDGKEFEWDGEEEGYGVYKDFDVKDPFFQGIEIEVFKFIIKKPKTWAGQSSDTIVNLADYAATATLTEDGRPLLHVYSASGEGNQIDCYTKKEDANGDHFINFYLAPTWDRLSTISTGVCISYDLYAFDPAYYEQNSFWQEYTRPDYLVARGTPNAVNFDILFEDMAYPDGRKVEADPSINFYIEGKYESAPNKTKKKVATFDRLYDTEKFVKEYTYNGDDLGAIYTPQKTEFRVWSPISGRVDLLLYFETKPGVHKKDPTYRFKMSKQPGGVWSCSVKGDLEGYHYAFDYMYGGASHVGIDPYAKACGFNGLRGAIIDPEKSDPEGFRDWNLDPIPTNHLTVYEAHIRDLTSHETWVGHYGNKKGTYNAFVERGTTYNGYTTGYDHIKELGVNAVQLLPVFDQENEERTLIVEDENGEKKEVAPAYNWGYNPHNYNCPEGSYSSDPSNPYARILELKGVVNELAKDGIRTVMDVVYNHVSSVTTHPFSIAMPRYYFRYDNNAFLIDNTGVGNTINSDRVMAKNFIVDSTCYWAEEYRMKGFRFDLMGCLTVDTMREVKDRLYEIDPDIVVYGEGWTGAGYNGKGESANTYNTYRLLKDNGKGAIGCFNDAYRDGMKGNTTWADVVPSGGFMSGLDHENWRASVGAIGENKNVKDQGIPTPASASIDYIACHDNYTLYDQFKYLLHGQKQSAQEHADAVEAVVAASAHSFFGQGIAFINGGDEIMRTKLMRRGDPMFDAMVESYKHNSNETSSWIEGDGIEIDEDTWLVRNSYKYGDACNAFDWSRKAQFHKAYSSIKEALAYRNAHLNDGLFGQTQEEIESGRTICMANSAIGARFKDAADNAYLLLTAGAKHGDVRGVPEEAQGVYRVLYCSSGRLEKGSEYNVATITGIANERETLFLQKVK